MHAVQGCVTRFAHAVAFVLARKASPDKLTHIQLTLAALEATLPEGSVQRAGRWTGAKTWEAVYSAPSQAIYVLQGLQEAVRRVKFRAGIAAGRHWSDVIHLDGLEVPPHALTIARALAGRLDARGHVWMAFQGYAAWDQAATAALSLSCNVRYHRSRWQRDAEQAYRATDHIGQAAQRLGLSSYSTSLRLRRASIQHVDTLDLVICRQLDAVAAV